MEKFMTQEEINLLLKTCIPSKEMREYLMTQNLSENTLAHILAGSLLPLKEKAKLAWGVDKQVMNKALAELTLKSGEMFYLIDAWYDQQIKDEKVYPSVMCRDYDTALSYIRRDMEDDGDDRYGCQWYILKKWAPDDRGVMVNTYTYYMIEVEVIYFESNFADEVIENRSHYAVSGDSLNLPIPFEVGNLLTVDCTPFMPPVTALLIEKGDNHDCCCLQVLYKDTTGELRTAALKHGLHFTTASGEDYWPNIVSPLYRLSKFTGKLSEDEKLLLRYPDSNCIAVNKAKDFAKSTVGDFIYIYGDYGTGKTHLLSAVKTEICNTNPKTNVIYISAGDFLDNYIQNILEGAEREYITEFKNADVFLLDDLQYLREKEASSEQIFYIVDHLIQGGKRS